MRLLNDYKEINEYVAGASQVSKEEYIEGVVKQLSRAFNDETLAVLEVRVEIIGKRMVEE